MKEFRRVPLAMLRKRLKVQEYEREAPFENVSFTPARVRIKLSQHAGKPARPVVARGDRLQRGALVGRVDAAELGANVHSSIDGTVESVTDSFVEVVR
jgi:Na+-translocating ferredoxin:NAD+ oxidoreductase RnfC subunit